jgi:hypothetical protein
VSEVTARQVHVLGNLLSAVRPSGQKSRSPDFGIIDSDGTVMQCNYPTHNRQTQSYTTRFFVRAVTTVKKWLHNLFMLFRRNSRTIVANFDQCR